MNRDFLKEAIADAKAVKESAIANAKVALEEAFSPSITAAFAQKLEEMDKEDKMEESYDEVAEAKGAKEDVKEVEDIDEAKKEDLDEAKEEIDEAKKEDLDEAKEDVDEELNEILAELEELDLEEGKEDVDEAEGDDDDKDDKEDDDEEIDLENMSEEDLKKFIEGVIEDMVKAGELEPADDFEDDVEVDVDADGEIEIEDDEETSVDEAKDMDESYDKVDEAKDDLDEAKKDLEEAMDTIQTLRSELNEINLLNAKLLYTNKVFRGKNLTEDQKVKVLKAFDKAETVKEVKLVFETLDTSVKNKRNAKNITEARAKGSASNIVAGKNVKRNTKQPIVESNEMVNRFKKLAGII